MKFFPTGRHSSFTYLNTTQFLGALNDNVFKLLIAFFLIHIEGQEETSRILATAGGIFVLPFLLFSAAAGTLADRFSKRNIIVFSKILEVVVMTLGMTMLWLGSPNGAYLTLFLMATQSSLFGPSKYGIVPEIVEQEKLSRANGHLTAFTYFAVIIGTFLASFATDISERNFVAVSALCVLISIVGMITSFYIEYTEPAGSKKKVHPFFLLDIYRTLRRANQENTLFLAILGSGYFLFSGAYVQLNMIPFAIESLGLDEVKGGYLFLITALGIGAGSTLAARISGKHIELGLIPIGGLGMACCAFLLYLFQSNLYGVLGTLFLVGVMAGLYVVPLDAFIQWASPRDYRGKIVAASNFVSFMGVLFASAMLMLTSEVMGLKAAQGFIIMGITTLLVTSAISFSARDYLIRFLGMILSRLRFELTSIGEEAVPPGEAAVLVTPYTAWDDSLLVLGSQRQRIHFLIECKKGRSPWVRLAQRLLWVTTKPDLDPRTLDDNTWERITKNLRKGRSICILLQDADSAKIDDYSAAYRERLADTDYPVVSVKIQIDPKNVPDHGWLYRYLRRARTPALIQYQT
jgi:acyl-[acyl-carrier-protein]-phospholipid O-acyltransferase/long-chain-fatty-acid--[acyl-carrier-protein] ligase